MTTIQEIIAEAAKAGAKVEQVGSNVKASYRGREITFVSNTPLNVMWDKICEFVRTRHGETANLSETAAMLTGAGITDFHEIAPFHVHVGGVLPTILKAPHAHGFEKQIELYNHKLKSYGRR